MVSSGRFRKYAYKLVPLSEDNKEYPKWMFFKFDLGCWLRLSTPSLIVIFLLFQIAILVIKARVFIQLEFRVVGAWGRAV
ncbi:uncharacterized protein K452DRAFT_291881 [Aplosporella prunicola CBS 121167]|uniref:Uncharacterized protein n=1 Tax=Aplosporella prunicola CBS 121167 TaxID=1176127 RepID=A0A6A6B1G5_9PEZI|nr:uncharacterized protein K452DRAFT_291881 [Aplosporella prunicola CBS 121167]KAF2137105.1 hypothetical protein K452DRAFT_291881 [Aplosporella prunicola CBS 121167]